MHPGERKSVRLRSSLEGSASWVRVLDDGRLEVEFYDYGEEAEAAFGNDVAFVLRLDAVATRNVAATLLESSSAATTEALLAAMDARFASYFDVRDWLDANAIPYEKSFDGHA